MGVDKLEIRKRKRIGKIDINQNESKKSQQNLWFLAVQKIIEKGGERPEEIVLPGDGGN